MRQRFRICSPAPVLWILSALVVGSSAIHADSFTFSGDRTSVVLTEGRERTLLQGNATIISNNFELTADEIELWGTDFQFAVGRRNVSIFDTSKNIRIAAETIRFDRITENLRAEHMVVVEDLDNELMLKGEYLETRSGGDLIVVQTAVRVLKEDLTARAQFLRFRRLEDVLEFSGFPVLFWKGDEYRATRITMNLETEEIEMQGQVQGSIEVDDDEADGAEDGTDG